MGCGSSVESPAHPVSYETAIVHHRQGQHPSHAPSPQSHAWAKPVHPAWSDNPNTAVPVPIETIPSQEGAHQHRSPGTQTGVPEQQNASPPPCSNPHPHAQNSAPLFCGGCGNPFHDEREAFCSECGTPSSSPSALYQRTEALQQTAAPRQQHTCAPSLASQQQQQQPMLQQQQFIVQQQQQPVIHQHQPMIQQQQPMIQQQQPIIQMPMPPSWPPPPPPQQMMNQPPIPTPGQHHPQTPLAPASGLVMGGAAVAGGAAGMVAAQSGVVPEGGSGPAATAGQGLGGMQRLAGDGVAKLAVVAKSWAQENLVPALKEEAASQAASVAVEAAMQSMRCSMEVMSGAMAAAIEGGGAAEGMDALALLSEVM